MTAEVLPLFSGRPPSREAPTPQLLVGAGCHLEIQPGELRDPARTEKYPLTVDDVDELVALFDRPDVVDRLESTLTDRP